MEKALIVTHPHERWDHGAVGQDFVDYVQEFEGGTYVVPSVGRDRCEVPYGGTGIYDEVLQEQGFGKLKEEDVLEIASEYDKIVLGGGYARQCLENTHRSFEDQDIKIEVEPSITYDQSGSSSGFTMNKVIASRDRELIEEYLGQFEDGRTSLA